MKVLNGTNSIVIIEEKGKCSNYGSLEYKIQPCIKSFLLGFTSENKL